MTTANTTATPETSDPAPTSAASTPAASSASIGHRFAPSIRIKGLIVFVVLMAYSVVIAFFAFHQKNLLLRDFEKIQGALETETMLKQADVSAFHAVMAIFANIDASDHAAGMQRIQMHYQLLQRRQAELTARLPDASLNVAGLNAAWDEANKNSSRANLNRMIGELIEAKNDIAVLTEQVQENRKSLSERYRTQSDSAAMTTLVLGMLGLGLLGAIIGLFFRRLTDD